MANVDLSEFLPDLSKLTDVDKATLLNNFKTDLQIYAKLTPTPYDDFIAALVAKVLGPNVIGTDQHAAIMSALAESPSLASIDPATLMLILQFAQQIYAAFFAKK